MSSRRIMLMSIFCACAPTKKPTTNTNRSKKNEKDVDLWNVSHILPIRLVVLMKLSFRSEYALLALVHLARCPNGEFVSVETIANAQGIPKKFLEQIMLLLKRERCVRSAKGNRGGYQLARPASEIRLSEVIRLFDGALAPTESVSEFFYEPTPIEREKKLVGVLRDIRNYISDKLEKTTIEQMM